MLGGEEEGVGEGVAAGLEAEFQMPVLKAHAKVMLGAVPRRDVGFKNVRERVLGVGIVGVRAEENGGQCQAPLGEQINRQGALSSGRSLKHGCLSKVKGLVP